MFFTSRRFLYSIHIMKDINITNEEILNRFDEAFAKVKPRDDFGDNGWDKIENDNCHTDFNCMCKGEDVRP